MKGGGGGGRGGVRNYSLKNRTRPISVNLNRNLFHANFFDILSISILRGWKGEPGGGEEVLESLSRRVEYIYMRSQVAGRGRKWAFPEFRTGKMVGM